MVEKEELIHLITRTIQTPDDLEPFARELYNNYLASHKLVLLLLDGNLGAGKTAFSRALGHILGVKENINSPTFNLLNRYEGEKTDFYHYDLYRIASPEDLRELDFPGYWDGSELPPERPSVHAIEWPDRAGDSLPRGVPTYLLRFEYDPLQEDAPRTVHVYRR